MANRSFALLGASGLVGGQLLRLLAREPAYTAGTVLTRRPLNLAGATPGENLGKVTEAIVDFEQPESLRGLLAVDDVYCCLGTTIKVAGSQEAFRNVDCVIPAAAARQALAAGARQFLIVTAVGADPESRVFYNRVKGEVEASLRLLEFPGGVKILRPSMLLGDRAESRPAERLGKAVMRATNGLFRGGLARYRAIDATDVARAMRRAALGPSRPGVEVYEGESLFKLTLPDGPSTADTHA